MDVLNEIGLRMDKIRKIFQDITAIFPLMENLKSLTEKLENTENEFRSVAYEAAAMALAVKDISKGFALKEWREFMEGPGAKHTTQIHVGLGWALAQQRVEVLPIIKTLDPVMRFRVLDGYGYYDGIFRQRKTITNRIVPDEMDANLLPGYDQGLGRSMWYTCKGECESVSGMIGTFPASRHKDLWRGTGIACVYVGGYDENILRKLFTLSSENHSQLSVGAALVSRSRGNANAPTPYTELACRIWCNCTAEEVMRITVNAESLIAGQPDDAYMAWLSNIREELMSSKIN
ncbi:MAG: DUF1702 family protein [Flavitalea sp.]